MCIIAFYIFKIQHETHKSFKILVLDVLDLEPNHPELDEQWLRHINLYIEK